MGELLDFFTGAFSRFVWQGILLPCVFFGGIFFTFQTRGLQVFRFGTALRETVGRLFEKREKTEGGISPFQALCTALAGTVGTGSVVGTCQALALGGPGALFWMWIAAFFGMIIKFYEVALAVFYRSRTGEGEWVGGPMYYIEKGMGKSWKFLGVLFSLFGICASFGMGDLAQANGVFSGTLHALSGFVPLTEEGEGKVGIALAVFLLFCLGVALFGGAKRVGQVCSFVVPFMSLFFVCLSLVVIFCHPERLPAAISCVLSSAFSFKAAVGAGTGIGMKTALEWGLKRSAFSNEAGLGSAAIAHAAADTPHPVTQGFFGIFEVFVDTLVICSLTGIAVLVSLPMERILSHTAPDTTLIGEAFSTVFPPSFSSLFIGGSLALFAFSTLLGWSLYGEKCARYLLGKKAVIPYRLVFLLLAVMGIFFPMTRIWSLSDAFNGLMAIPNFIALFALSGKVKELVKDYFEKSALSRRKRFDRTPPL